MADAAQPAATAEPAATPAAATPAAPSKPADDTGLGFNDFFDRPDPAPEGEDTPSPAAAAADEKKQEVTAGAEDIPPAAGVKKEEPKVDAKPEVKTGSEGKPEVKAEEKTPITRSKWDTAENPYVAQVAQLDARLTETRNYATTVNQQNQTLARQVEILGQKIDGTWDPAAPANKEPTPQEIAHHAEIKGKVTSSISVAEERFGKDFVHQQLFAEGAPFRKFDTDATIQARVLNAPAPVLEALQVLKEQDFQAKYGRDPEAIKDAIRKELEPELRTKITEELRAQFDERLRNPERKIASLGEARGSGNAGAAGAADTAPARVPMRELGNPGLA